MKWVLYGLIVMNVGYFAWQIRQHDPSPVPVSADEREVNAHGLLLLSEVDASELKVRKAIEPIPVDGEPGENAPPPAGPLVEAHRGNVCYSVGPLAAGERIEAMRLWLEEQGAGVVLRERERREVSMYWVYLPPFPSRTAALERVAALERDGIDDIYVIPGGDMANAVSLGMYSRRTSLERRLAALKEKGYDPSVAPRYSTKTAAWLDTEFPPDGAFPDKAFSETFPGAEFAEHRCTDGGKAIVSPEART